MNLEFFFRAVQTHRPIAVVLQRDDYAQLELALPGTPGAWNRERMQYLGAPIVRSEFYRSYIVEDTPDGPVFHVVS